MTTTEPDSGAWRRWQQRTWQKEERDTERNKEMMTGGVQSDKDYNNDLLQLKTSMIKTATNQWRSWRRSVTKGSINIYCTYSMQHSPSWEANRFSASQEIPHILCNPLFIASFTGARHLSLSCARSIQSMPSNRTSWKFILILSSHLRLDLPSGSFPQVSPSKLCIQLSSPPYVLHAPPNSFFSI